MRIMAFVTVDFSRTSQAVPSVPAKYVPAGHSLHAWFGPTMSVVCGKKEKKEKKVGEWEGHGLLLTAQLLKA